MQDKSFNAIFNNGYNILHNVTCIANYICILKKLKHFMTFKLAWMLLFMYNLHLYIAMIYNHTLFGSRKGIG